MAFTDNFKGKQYKQELDQLKSIITPELQQCVDISAHIDALNQKAISAKKESEKLINSLSKKIEKERKTLRNVQAHIESLKNEITEKKTEVFQIDEEILMQSFGLYKPMFAFATSEKYKQQLAETRQKQKAMIKAKTAYTTNPAWTVNGSAAKGRKMSNDMGKLLLRAFNNESDELISKVKFNNFDLYKNRITKSYEQISKLGGVVGVSLISTYLKYKIQELHMAFEFAQKRQEEKELAKEERARLREEEKLRKEIEMQTAKIKKEESHFKQALEKYQNQLLKANEETQKGIQEKINEINAELELIEKQKADMDYRINNTRAGYVYVISNIGSFGESVYKISMTRRLEPLDRVKELGDASVPFKYDVHALVFSDDAPQLENALHKAFKSNCVNLVNLRKEFFKVNLDEIIHVIKGNHNKTVEFDIVPAAEEFRISSKMRVNL